MKNILIFTLLFLSTTSYAGRIRDLDFTIDTSNFGVNNTFTITVFLIKKNGKRITLAPNQFSLYWGKLKVTGQHILSFKHGLVTFDQSSIFNGNNKTILDISYNNGQHTMQADIIYPYVNSLNINNNSITVNHFNAFDYDLVFSNGKTTNHSNNLFNENNLINTSSPDIKISDSKIMLQLEEPSLSENIKLSFKNKLNDQFLGEKLVNISYPTTCRIEVHGIDGANGIDGKDGVKTSEIGSKGTNGQNGLKGKDIVVLAKTKNVNSKRYIILQTFATDGSHQTEIIWFDGSPIVINSNGGNGGNGGKGGDGMKGLIDKTKQINSPNGGNGGNGGNAGNAGNAGNVNVIISKSSEDLKSFFSISSNGGTAGKIGIGGSGGKGDYSDTNLAGKILTTRDGKQGNNGIRGVDGTNGIINTPQIVSEEEWIKQYEQYLKEGFIK